MPFDKIIISSISNVVKNSIKFEDSIDKLLSRFEDSCPSRDELLSIIDSKNQTTEALQQTQQALSTLEKTTNTVDKVITGIDVTVKTIKAIPAPTAVLGVGIPINVLTILSDVLDMLGKLIDQGKGALSVIPQSTKTINSSITQVLNKLVEIDSAINKCLQQEIDKEAGTDATDEEREIAQDKILGEINFHITEIEDDDASLQQNSNNPRFYKGYQLMLEHESSNTISAPKRRIKGVKLEGNKKSPTSIVLYNQPDGSYSFSSSVEILINEIKFRIDTDDDGKLEEAVETLLYEPFGEPGDNNEVRQTKDGKSWYFNQNSLQWILMYQPFGEPSTHGEIRSYDYNKENKPDLGLRFFVFGENGVEGIKVTLPSSTSGPGGAWFLIYAPFYVPGANNEKRYSEKEKKMYTFSESRKQWVREN